MREIITSLLQLKEAFAECEGEILGITLDKKGVDALNAECQNFCLHIPISICPTCGANVNNLRKVLGIEIVESVNGTPTR